MDSPCPLNWLITNPRHARIHHPPRGIQVACAHLKRQSKDPHAQPSELILFPKLKIGFCRLPLPTLFYGPEAARLANPRHARIHHPPRSIQVARAHLKRQSKDPICPTLRADPFPKVKDLFCRLPLPTLFYGPEAARLANPRHARIHHPPRSIQVARAHLKRQSEDPICPTLRADPFPKVKDLRCRLPVPTLFYGPRGC